MILIRHPSGFLPVDVILKTKAEFTAIKNKAVIDHHLIGIAKIYKALIFADGAFVLCITTFKIGFAGVSGLIFFGDRYWICAVCADLATLSIFPLLENPWLMNSQSRSERGPLMFFRLDRVVDFIYQSDKLICHRVRPSGPLF